MKTFCILVATVLLAGCASPKMNTGSGGPEVTIARSVDDVKAKLLMVMVDRGYTPISSDSIQLVFERQATGAAAILLASRYDPTVWVRVKYTFIPIAGHTRVLSRLYTISNRGSAFHREEEMWGDWKNLQYQLECLAADLEGRERPPEPPKPPTVPAKSPKDR